MHHSVLAALLSALPYAFAQQYGDNSSPKTPTSSAAKPAASTASASGPVHTVTVGDGGQLAFSPSNIKAAIGDTVEFHFFPPQHSVAQSSFDSPCTPLNSTSFFSGGMTTTSGENKNTFSVMITDTSPMWFYCAFPTHCQTGMTGVINPPVDGSKTLAQYQAAAAKVGSTVAPTTVQGGVVGPAKAQTSGSSTSAAPMSPSVSPSGTQSAGVEARSAVSWSLLSLVGFVAAGFGGFIL